MSFFLYFTGRIEPMFGPYQCWKPSIKDALVEVAAMYPYAQVCSTWWPLALMPEEYVPDDSWVSAIDRTVRLPIFDGDRLVATVWRKRRRKVNRISSKTP